MNSSTPEEKITAINECYKDSRLAASPSIWKKIRKFCLAVLAAIAGAVVGGVVAGVVTGGIAAIPGAIASGGVAAAAVLGVGAGGAVTLGATTGHTLFKARGINKNIKDSKKKMQEFVNKPQATTTITLPSVRF